MKLMGVIPFLALAFSNSNALWQKPTGKCRSSAKYLCLFTFLRITYHAQTFPDTGGIKQALYVKTKNDSSLVQRIMCKNMFGKSGKYAKASKPTKSKVLKDFQ